MLINIHIIPNLCEYLSHLDPWLYNQTLLKHCRALFHAAQCEHDRSVYTAQKIFVVAGLLLQNREIS